MNTFGAALRLDLGLLAWLAGTFAQLTQPALWSGASYGALAAGAVLVLAVARAASSVRRPPAAARDAVIANAIAAAVALAACGCAFTGWRAVLRAADALPAALDGIQVEAAGRVATMPDLLAGSQRFLFEPDLPQRGLPEDVHGPWLVSWWPSGKGAAAPLPTVRAGDRWQLPLRLRAPHGAMNPHGFDAELWLWEQGVPANASVRPQGGAQPRRLASGWAHPVERLRQHVRDGIVARIEQRTRAGVVAALAVGDQRAIAREDWEVFRATGVAHLVSISGLHVTMFAWLAGAAVVARWRRSTRLCLWLAAPHAGVLGGCALAAAYAVFSGWGVPSQRTVVMLAVVSLLKLAGLRWPWPRVLLLAAVAVCAIDPWALLQAGFWLSFFAVGVLLVAGSAPAPAGRAWAAWRLLREQGIVTLALAPLTLLLFGQLSIAGLPANLLAIPWVTLVVTPLSLAGVLFAPLWDAAGWAVAALLAVLRWFAAWPGATWSAAAAPWALALPALAGGVLLVARLPLGLRLPGLPLLLPAMLWQPPRPPAGTFELLAADIGQGNAVLVRTATHTLLYDAGPPWADGSDAGQRVLVPLMRALGESPQVLVVSHRDTDHSGGAAAVLAAHPRAQLWTSIEDSHPLVRSHGARRCRRGVAWDWDGVRLRFLGPRGDEDPLRTRPNALSCVLRIEAADGTAALLAGDIEQPQEAALLAAPDAAASLPAALLLVPHHGSRTSSSPAFLDAVAPRMALVQAGWHNRFGHPVPAVMARYEERRIPVRASPACGAMHWSSRAPDAVRCEREQDLRYWRHRP